jgi:hypothetical protein
LSPAPQAQAIKNRGSGYTAFTGQPDDGSCADVQTIFALLQLHSPGKIAQGGLNIHRMSLCIPILELAATSRSSAFRRVWGS